MSEQNIGPFFGVPLPAHLDFPGGTQKELPTAKELVSVVDGATPQYRSLTAKTIQSLEVALALVAAIDRGGYDVSPCLICQELTVCIPDGLAICRLCAEKAGG
jgi:hypothetical protein